MPASRLDTAVIETFGDRQTTLITRAMDAAEAVWLASGGLDADLPTFVAALLEVSDVFQTASSELSHSYLETLLDVTIEADRVELIEFDPVMPVARARKMVGLRHSAEMAEVSGLKLARNLISQVLVRQSDQTLERAAAKSPVEIVGWRRVPRSDACKWCRLVSSQRYHTIESATKARHDHCRCKPAPIYGDNDPGQVINVQTQPDE